MTISNILPGAIDALVNAYHGAPFQILGPHMVDDHRVVIRAMRPAASQLFIVLDKSRKVEMQRLRPEGLFEGVIQGTLAELAYHYEAITFEGDTEIFHDAYAFRESFLGEMDLYLLREGNHLQSYKKMGAHLREVNGIKGVNFAVWAPNAQRISVIGNFNHWDERVHPMQMIGDSGIWELFIPGVEAGAVYRYDLLSRFNGYRAKKTDPYGFYAERRPQNASIVFDLDQYEWNDEAWVEARAQKNPLVEPMSTYEVHPGSWKRNADGEWLTYRELAEELVAYVKEMGYTHIELLPIAEHPFDGSWGYQVTGYFAATSRYGSPTDFMYFVDYCHQNGIGVILDWVPAHFPKDGHALSYFDGTHLYEHDDPRLGEHPDWGTYIFNYGRTEVRNFLLANALFWLKKFHIDGLRVDAVSSMLYLSFSRQEGQWVPNKYGGNENLEAVQFIKDFNEIVHQEVPGVVTIAEESTAWAMVSRPTYVGGLGFTLKWNMGWMHDTLKYIQVDPVYRRYHHNQVTFSLFYAFSENFVLALSHDEVVHGKGSLINKASGDWWQKFATLRLLFGYQFTHPGKKLHFMGQEFGQWREWSEARGLDWHLLVWETHKGLQNWVRDLNQLYKSEPALYEHDFDFQGFKWIEPNDADNSVFTYVRFADNPEDFLVIACNFTPVVRSDYCIGVPAAGSYIELLNSDSVHYGGSNIGNGGSITAHASRWHAFDHSIRLTLPPLAILILKPQK
jgi:1,4-alpha-glucan branching enzyme